MNNIVSASAISAPLKLPARIDLRGLCPAVYDQGDFNACTANVLAGDIEFVKMKQGQNQTGTPSRMDIYEQERQRGDRFPEDGGAALADGIAVCRDTGISPETDWPYTQDALNQAPTAKILADRQNNRIRDVINIDNTDVEQLKKSLADGYPVTCNIIVFDSFMSEETFHTGNIPMPKPGEKQVGGHAMLIVGYDDAASRFVVRNSFKLDDGSLWGDQGYGTLPYGYVSSPDLAYPNECWSIRAVDTGQSS